MSLLLYEILMLDVIHILLSKISFLDLRYSRTKWFVLSKNIEDKVLWQLLITMTNSNTSNKSLSRISSGDHKRTQQGVPIVLLPYLYYYMWPMLQLYFYCAFYSKVHVSSMSTPCVHYVVAMWLTCSLTLSSRLFPTSLDCSRP